MQSATGCTPLVWWEAATPTQTRPRGTACHGQVGAVLARPLTAAIDLVRGLLPDVKAPPLCDGGCRRA